MLDTTKDLPALRRGPGRPPGSANRPRAPMMPPEEREALKRKLAVDYRDAVTSSLLAQVRVRGIRTVITNRLGRESLAEVEAEIIADHERRGASDEESCNG